MNSVYYIGLDIHKKSITFVIKTFSGQLIRRGAVEATRPALTAWANEIDHPWTGGREAASRAAAREGRCNGPRPPPSRTRRTDDDERPAGPCGFGDCAREPLILEATMETVSRPAGKTLTESSARAGGRIVGPRRLMNVWSKGPSVGFETLAGVNRPDETRFAPGEARGLCLDRYQEWFYLSHLSSKQPVVRTRRLSCRHPSATRVNI